MAGIEKPFKWLGFSDAAAGMGRRWNGSKLVFRVLGNHSIGDTNENRLGLFENQNQYMIHKFVREAFIKGGMLNQ
jgi:hypothetical protein